MYKVSKDTLKKSIRHLMAISVITTLLMASMSITTTMNANAFNFGLKSEDVNTGSIDTNSLFSCVGAAINCVNTNQDNNNVIANNSAGQPNPPNPLTCEECIINANLSDDQFDILAAVLNLDPGVATLEDICDALENITGSVLFDALTTPGFGFSTAEANALIDCLIEAGFTNLIEV